MPKMIEPTHPASSGREFIRTILGKQYASVFEATVVAFPGLTIVQDRADPCFAIVPSYSAEIPDEHILNLRNYNRGVDLPEKIRLSKRLGLPETYPGDSKLDGCFRLFAFAHSIAHILQKDPEFSGLFGVVMPDMPSFIYSHDPTKPNDEWELNADYITAELLSVSGLGRRHQIAKPAHQPADWQTWATGMQLPDSQIPFI